MHPPDQPTHVRVVNVSEDAVELTWRLPSKSARADGFAVALQARLPSTQSHIDKHVYRLNALSK